MSEEKEITVADISDKVEGIADELMKWREQADEEIKAHGEASVLTMEKMEELEQKLDDLNVRVERDAIPSGAEKKLPRNIGEQFIESKAYTDMIAKGTWESDRFEVKEIVSEAAASGGDLIVPQRVPGIITDPEQPLTIRNLLSVGKTTSNAIDYVVETVFTNAAAAVNESQEGSLVSKPESTLRFDKSTASVGTVAHWIPASRQMVADYAQLQSYINTRLTYGLKLVEDQALADAIVAAATAYDTTLPTTLGVEGTTQIDDLRCAILQARQAFYPVTGIVLNPQDWAAIELRKDSQERYIWVNVSDGGMARMWRVPVVESDAITAGSFLVGAFKMGAQIWDREGVTIRISEHHASYFVQNLVAILCEERYALTIYRPEAFITGDFTAASS